jgi:RNA polymerase sigma factor (sigma-70 family)
MQGATEVQVDDATLATAIYQGTPGYEERLFRKFSHSLVSFMMKYTGELSRAEDLSQETLLIVIKKLRSDGINDPERLSAYIYATAKYVYIGWLRKKDNQVELFEDMDQMVNQCNEVEYAYMQEESVQQVQRSIQCLSVERDKDILQRHYLLEQSKDEICAALTLSVPHYDRVISRARGRLRDSLSAASWSYA